VRASEDEPPASDDDGLLASFNKALLKRRGVEEFGKLLEQDDDDDLDVLRCALWIAQHRNADLDVELCIRQMDELAKELEEYMPPQEERYPLRVIGAINKFVYEVKGIKGNTLDYYDPDNSCIDKVLAGGPGIPITIALLYMELARRVGFPMVGVNLPAHFMIRPMVGDMEVLVDVFNEGKILFVEDAEELLAQQYGPEVTVKIDRSFFTDNTVRPRNFLTRMLTNLKQIYFNSTDYDSALTIAEYQAYAAPTDDVKNFNRRDRGILFYLMKRYPEATEALSEYLEADPEAQDAPRIRDILRSMEMPADGGLGMGMDGDDDDRDGGDDDDKA